MRVIFCKLTIACQICLLTGCRTKDTHHLQQWCTQHLRLLNVRNCDVPTTIQYIPPDWRRRLGSSSHRAKYRLSLVHMQHNMHSFLHLCKLKWTITMLIVISKRSYKLQIWEADTFIRIIYWSSNNEAKISSLIYTCAPATTGNNWNHYNIIYHLHWMMHFTDNLTVISFTHQSITCIMCEALNFDSALMLCHTYKYPNALQIMSASVCPKLSSQTVPQTPAW